MRKYLRAMAHAKMKKEGVIRMNKKRVNPRSGMRTEPSYFATNWRKYC